MDKASRKNQIYSVEFKLKLVHLYLGGQGGTARGIASEHGLKDSRQVRDWVKKFHAGELNEKDADRRGKSTATKGAFQKTRFVSKETECAYLRFENEYLKKKLLSQGESENSIASLWSSKNPKRT